jgi:hypothetical protein
MDARMKAATVSVRRDGRGLFEVRCRDVSPPLVIRLIEPEAVAR